MPLMSDPFGPYLKKLRETPIEEHTEHTGRAALEALLNHFAADAKPRLNVQHEPKRAAERGAPDFKIAKPGQIMGYVEVKEIGENLDKVLKSEQIAKYRKLSSNIVLTDYLDFIWIDSTSVRDRARIAHQHDIEGRKLHIAPDKAAAVSKLLTGFFSQTPDGIGKSQQLALALATRSQLLRDYMVEELVRQEKHNEAGRLYGLFGVFRSQVFHELTLKEFADAFAQMLAYGLFLAKLNAGLETVTLNNAREHIPGSFRLIRELVDFLTELNQPEYKDIRWVVEEVLSIVNGINLNAIHEDLSFRNRKAISRKIRAGDEEEHRLFERDPFIYFYEDFLRAYDKETRKSRGVYYTPPPVVNFIVRAVDDILKDSFGIADGLADHKRVTVLDFACGTGTFLLEAFEKIFENIGGAESGKAGLVVREHLLKNLYGFEYLIAPYTIAHLKLSQYLRDKGHPLKDDERLQVFLTNTLEPVEPQKNLLLPEISREVEAAQKVKDKPILVIMGNPPYSGHSKNNSAYVKATIDAYKMVDGKPLGEKNPKWLQDDYVKFIRFAQMKMDRVDEGIVGVITNHSWLDNVTFRGMRQSLLATFDRVYILDLHGSTKPRESTPEGITNENVFDIQKGVAISLFVKKRGVDKGVYFADFWGSRIEKYRAVAEAEYRSVQWELATFQRPYYTYRPINWRYWVEYEDGWPISTSLGYDGHTDQVFKLSVLGFQTHRDHFAIAFEQRVIEQRLADMLDSSLSDVDLQTRYEIPSNRDWKLRDARGQLSNNANRNSQVVQCSYRPFDDRFCFFGQEFMDYPRSELQDHVFEQNNFCLGVGRSGNAIPERPWELASVSTLPIDANYYERGGVTVFPIRLFSNGYTGENFSPAFRDFLDARYNHHFDPEEVLGYIYAVLHAPAYRSRYAEFLRIDFPRIPFPEAKADFDALKTLGWALVEAHLLQSLPRLQLARYHGKGGNGVEAVRYSPEEKAVYINKNQYFAPVPAEVWEFHIGGYQVLEKYLKSRKGRTLSLDEINHVSHIADALAFTVSQMQAIDSAYAAAFPGRG